MYYVAIIRANNAQHYQELKDLLSRDFKNATFKDEGWGTVNSMEVKTPGSRSNPNKNKTLSRQQKKQLRRLGYRVHDRTVYGP